MGGKSSSTPPPPDYRAAASEQGELNREAMREQTFSNRPTQVTPWGRLDWRTGTMTDPTTGSPYTTWTQEQTLDPRLQGALDSQIGLAGDRSGLAGSMFGRVRDAYGQPLDYGQFRTVSDVGDPNTFRQAGSDAAYRRSTSRLDPRFADERSALEIRLRNRGLRAGDEAYDAEMERLDRRETDAYQQAMDAAQEAGRAESSLAFGQASSRQLQEAQLRQQEIAEALQRRGMPLDEINMLLAGQGVQPPGTPGYSSAGYAAPADMFGAAGRQYDAATDAYNARQAQRQSNMQGLVGLGTAAMGMFSDHRVKTDIVHVGYLPSGTPVYTWRYVWGGAPVRGVMAHDVPEAASVDPVTGLLWVDYGKVR